MVRKSQDEAKKNQWHEEESYGVSQPKKKTNKEDDARQFKFQEILKFIGLD